MFLRTSARARGEDIYDSPTPHTPRPINRDECLCGQCACFLSVAWSLSVVCVCRSVCVVVVCMRGWCWRGCAAGDEGGEESGVPGGEGDGDGVSGVPGGLISSAAVSVTGSSLFHPSTAVAGTGLVLVLAAFEPLTEAPTTSTKLPSRSPTIDARNDDTVKALGASVLGWFPRTAALARGH